jgi:protein MpaA
MGRPIIVTRVSGAHPRHRIVVFGCIHGDEPAGTAVARALEHLPVAEFITLWVVEDLNPDGVVLGTRQNAHRVDLNRNFPYRWRPLGHPGSVDYSGPGPGTEPETQIAVRLLTAVRPDVTIWFHQHQDLVDDSGGDPAIERRYAQLVGLPFERLTRYPGSAAGWQNAALQPTTAFVVELPAGALSAATAMIYARAVQRLLPS